MRAVEKKRGPIPKGALLGSPFSIKSSQLESLLEQLDGFVPQAVLFVERGGRPLGNALAQRFNVPALGIDVAYPLSRFPWIIRWVTFPMKEIAYRLTSPRLMCKTKALARLETTANLLVVDDSASSGKTVRVVRDTLAMMGHRGEVRIAVGQLGRRAMPLVDAALNRR